MPRRPPLPIVLFLGWLVPGAGHFVLGRRAQAAVFFLAITLTYLAGMALGAFCIVNPEHFGYWFIAQIMNGGETLLAWFLTKDHLPTQVPRLFGVVTADIGMLYTAVASLLNVWVVCSAWGIVLERDKEAAAPPPAEIAA
jgi:hypothetical protein